MADPAIGNPAPFSPEMDSSKGLQAGHTLSDDVPVDVNFNALLARSQAQTTDMAGKNYESSAARRAIIADHLLHKLP